MNLKILTPNGFVNFSGIKRSETVRTIYKVILEDNNFIECTSDHLLFTNLSDTIKCVDIIPNETLLYTKDGYKKVLSIEKNEELDYVYDVLGVNNDTSSFYANDILVHNCSFIGSTITLIDAAVITEKLSRKEPILIPDEFTKIWKHREKNRKYLLAIDTAGGVGSDSSVINIFDITNFPHQPAEQVAVYRNNKIAVPAFAAFVKETGEFWNEAYVVGEINGLSGEVFNRLFEEEYENLYYDYEQEVFGIHATSKTKPKAAMLFKDDLENGRIILYDETTIDEIGYFEEATPGVYKAQKGKNNHDDMVMTCLWASYFLKSAFFEDIKDTWSYQQTPEGEKEQYDEEEEDRLNAFLQADAEQNPDDWLDFQ